MVSHDNTDLPIVAGGFRTETQKVQQHIVPAAGLWMLPLTFSVSGAIQRFPCLATSVMASQSRGGGGGGRVRSGGVSWVELDSGYLSRATSGQTDARFQGRTRWIACRFVAHACTIHHFIHFDAARFGCHARNPDMPRRRRKALRRPFSFPRPWLNGLLLLSHA